MFRSCNLSLALPCTLSLPSTAFLKISSFAQHSYFPTCVLTPSFQLHQAFSTAHPTLPSWQDMCLLLRAKKISITFLTTFIPRLLSHLLQRKTYLYRYLQLFLQFRGTHFQFFTIFQVSQHLLGHVIEGNALPSPVFSQCPTGLTTSFAVATAF